MRFWVMFILLAASDANARIPLWVSVTFNRVVILVNNVASLKTIFLDAGIPSGGEERKRDPSTTSTFLAINSLVRRSMSAGYIWPSASYVTTISASCCNAYCIPVARDAHCPRLIGCFRTCTPASAATSAELSEEPSSITTI